MQEQHYFRRGKLPHLFIPNRTYFVTDRLFGSIPQAIIKELRAAFDRDLELLQKQKVEAEKTYLQEKGISPAERFKQAKYKSQKMYFKHFDDFSDTNLNAPYHLKNPEVA